MVPLVKYFQRKHKDLSSILRTHVKLILAQERGDRSCWPADMSYLGSKMVTDTVKVDDC